MKNNIVLFAALFFLAHILPAQKIDGNWYGVIEMKSFSTPFDITIVSNGAQLTGTYSIKGKFNRKMDVPIDTILLVNDSMKFKIDFFNSKVLYRGSVNLKENKITGGLQRGAGSPFVLNFGRTPVPQRAETSDENPAHEEKTFTRQDTLRGSITREREWWDLTYYHLDIKVNPEDKTIAGSVAIHYKVLQENKTMQIDLQSPLTISKVVQNGKELKFTQDGNVWLIQLNEKQNAGEKKSVTVHYSGTPKVAKNPPWDGGITWKKDANGLPFIASSCQGLGASAWWPCKDHMYDEADSMLISVNVPENLMDVSNGRLRRTEKLRNQTTTYHWFVSNPINNYGVNINIGDYTHFSEKYKGEKGILDCEYYVLKQNLEKAKVHFKDAERMLKAFEHWFGPYPFYEDSYKLVDAPYLGMEHQSSVTYGNGYQNGYLGRDLSGTGWGLKFDFIIIHESGHEWFANNITYKDIADMWIHEGFTAYSENLFVDYHYGKKASAEYCIGTRKNIHNDEPIIGPYNVNTEGSGDMYPKGANMLHTLRQIVNDDEKWRTILRGLNSTFYHQTVTTKQIEDFLSEKTGKNLKPFFDQYLRRTDIPTLEYRFEKNKIVYRWINCVTGFNMPVKALLNGKEKWLEPYTDWTEHYYANERPVLELDQNFYVGVVNSTAK